MISFSKISVNNGVLKTNFGNAGHFEKAIKMLDYGYDNLASDLIKEVGDVHNIKELSLLKKLLESLSYPFVKLPKDICDVAVNKLAKRFPENKFFSELNNSDFLINHRKAKLLEQQKQALKGLLKHAESVLENTENMDSQALLSEELVKKTDKLIGRAFEPNCGNYNTRDERTLNRFITSLIPAFFLGNDAYNIAKRNGKNDEESINAAKGKRNQELVATATESFTTLVTVGTFDKFSNNNQFGAPLLGAASSILGHVWSRISTGRRLTPVSIEGKDHSDSMEKFLSITKAKSTGNIEKKEHFLSFKNLGLFFATSIMAGFSLKYAGRALFKLDKIKQTSNSLKSWMENLTTRELKLTKSNFSEWFWGISKSKVGKLSDRYAEKIDEKLSQTGENEISLGVVEKTLKIPFIKQEIAIKDILQVPVLPFKLLFELASYPYKAVQKIFEEVASIRGFKDGELKNLFQELGSRTFESKNVKNEFQDILNIYQDFTKQRAKFKSNEEFQEFYSKHFNEKILRACNEETVSRVDNKKIGRMTQLLTMVASLYFAATDDYNQTAYETGDKEQAEKTARERLIQKAVRIVTQIGLMDIFNSVFKIQYSSSLLGMFTVAGFNTLATDSVTRVLAGNPITRQTKEEQSEMSKNREAGVLGGYYKLLKKVAE